MSVEQAVSVEGQMVTFSQRQGSGVLTVRVWLQGVNPRVMMWSNSTGGREPASLYLDEIQDYVKEAQKRVDA